MSEKKPNLLFILNDHQAYYGHGMQGGVKPMHPNFDAFAASGAAFSQSYSVTPMCGPTRRSFLTGLYPHTHGQVHNENDPGYMHDVYLDNLHEGGYLNYYYGKWHAGPGCAYDHHSRGFSQSGYGNPYNTPEYEAYCKKHGLPRARHRIERAFVNHGFKSYRHFAKMVPGAEYQCEEHFSGEHAYGVTITPEDTHEAFFLANLACEQLERLAENPDGQPWALRVDFWGPHQPFFPTQKYLDMYDRTEIPPYPSLNDTLEDKPRVLRMENNGPMGKDGEIQVPPPMSLEEWQDVLVHCYAHGTMVDAAGGRVLDKLKELGLDENTLIIWTTDHGDALACHGGHFDKDSHMAMEVIRTPLALSWKGQVEPGSRYDGYVFSCDVPCTLMDAAGLEFSNDVDGVSLLKLLRGEIPPRETLMLETYGHGYGTTIIGRTLLHDNWKYTCTEDDLDELYYLPDDPYEMTNLAILPEYAGQRQLMRDLLRKEQEKSKDPIPLEAIRTDYSILDKNHVMRRS